MTNIRLELCNRIRMEAEHINDTDFPLEVFPQTMQSVILDMARYENYKAEFIATAKLAAACGLVLGQPAALMGTILGLLLQLLFHLGALCVLPLFKRQVWSAYPMAPFLAIGYAVAYYV